MHSAHVGQTIPNTLWNGVMGFEGRSETQGPKLHPGFLSPPPPQGPSMTRPSRTNLSGLGHH